MKSPAYLSRDRHGAFLFRRRIPDDLRPCFNHRHSIRKSLRTRDRNTAVRRARRITVYLDGVFAQLKDKYQLEKRLAEARLSVADAIIAEITADLERRLTPEQRDILNDPTATPDAILQLLIDETLEQVAHQEQRKQNATERRKEAVAKSQIADRLEQRQRARKLIEEVEGDYGTTGVLTSTRTSTVPAPPPGKISPPFSELWNEYRQHKIQSGKWKVGNPIDDRKTGEYDSNFRDFLEIIGGDKSASEFDRHDAARVVEGLQQIPWNRTKLFPGKSLSEIPATARKIKKNTSKQRLENLKGFFTWLHREELIVRNWLDGRTIESDAKPYATPDKQDIQEWFNLQPRLIRKSWQYWIPRVAILTGARQSEIAQLLVSDIKKCPDTGIWFFDINDVDEAKRLKTKAAIRRVPISPDILNDQFFDYLDRVKTAGHKSLWPALNPKGGDLGATVSQYWARLRDRHNVLSRPVGDGDRQKVFHSLRRATISALRHIDGVDLVTIQGIVGHEPSMGITGSYLEEPVTLQQKWDAIKLLHFEGVAWGHHLKFKI